MKIQESLRINRGDLSLPASERVSTGSASFQRIITTYSKDISQEHLSKLLEDISQQGEQLSENPTFHELRKYKELVKKFMGEVTKNGVALHQTETWDPFGGNKTIKTIRVIDQKLMELTDHVRSEQTDNLAILERIGEIKGLLINLYT